LSDSADNGFRRAGIRVFDLSANTGQKPLAEFLQPP